MKNLNFNLKNSIFYLLGKIYLVKKSEYLSESDLEHLQRHRFESLVEYAMKHSKFYYEFYHDHNINEENFVNKSLSEFPKINKSILMENFDSFLTQKDVSFREAEVFISKENTLGKLYKNKYQIIHTSGSSGKIGIFIYDEDAWQTLKALAVTRVNKLSFSGLRKQNLVFIGATSGHYAGISLANSAPPELFKFTPVNINSPITDIIKNINKSNLDVLSGYSSGVCLLTQLQKDGKINISPTKIICSADPMTEAMKAEIYSIFEVNPINFYASSESICLGSQNSEDNRMYLFNDFHIFELLDSEGKYTKESGAGKLILTNLYNYIQPLIRYEMNDELIIRKNDIVSENNKKQWNFPILEEISGRSEEILRFKKDDNHWDYLHPLVFVEFYVPGLERFQIIQRSENSFEMLAKINEINYAKGSILLAIHKKMNSILEEKNLLDYVKFKVTLTDDIEVNKKTGKLKLVIPLER